MGGTNLMLKYNTTVEKITKVNMLIMFALWAVLLLER